MEKSSKVLSPADWDQVINDFATSEALQQKWLTAYPAQSLLELALNFIAKERGGDVSLKQQLLVFLEEHGALLIGKDVSAGLGRVIGVLKTLLGNSSQTLILTQVITLTAVLAVQTESQQTARGQLESLVDILLGVVSRVNSLSDRQVRGAAAEALRVLEWGIPCLLHSELGHLLAFCQAERTHVVQSYILLFLKALEHSALYLFRIGGGNKGGAAKRGRLSSLSEQVTSWVPLYLRSKVGGAPSQGNQGGQTPPLRRTSSGSASALLSTVAPLTPFTLPPFLSSTNWGGVFEKQELTEGTLKEFRRAVSFLLENVGVLSEPATAEVVISLIKVVSAAGLPSSIFKHHFAGLIHSSSPVLVHTALQVYLRFPEAYSDPSEKGVLLERLGHLANDPQQPLSARLLSLHWLLAIATSNDNPIKPPAFLPLLQPGMFDPIAVRAVKLETLAVTGPPQEVSRAKQPPGMTKDSAQGQGLHSETSHSFNPDAGVLSGADFESGSASGLEASVAFRTLHRFICSRVNPSSGQDPSFPDRSASEPNLPNPAGTIPPQISTHLVSIAADHPAQMPNILGLLKRLLEDPDHSQQGQSLLQTLETSLLPRLEPSRNLPAYFPLLQEMVTRGQEDPKPLLTLLGEYCANWAKAAGLETGYGTQAWLRGTEVLEVCRNVMLVQPRGKILEPLGKLLEGIADKFPDIEVRDSAKTYHALLTNLPEQRLHAILSCVETGGADSAMLLRTTSFSPSQSKERPPPNVASYIQLKRLFDPLVREIPSLNTVWENSSGLVL